MDEVGALAADSGAFRSPILVHPITDSDNVYAAMRFNTVGISDAMSMGTEGMSLAERVRVPPMRA